MIIQMKKDKIRGSEDLETFAHVFEALGLIFFSIFGGILVTKHHSGIIFFYLTLMTGVLIFIAGLIYSNSSEDHVHGHETNTIESFNSRWAMIKQFLKVNEIKNTLIFFFVVSIVNPNLEEYFVYFNEEEHELPAIYEGYMSIGLGFTAALLVMIYNVYLIKKTSINLKVIVLVASGFRVLSSLLAVYQTKDLHIKVRVWLLI